MDVPSIPTASPPGGTETVAAEVAREEKKMNGLMRLHLIPPQVRETVASDGNVVEAESAIPIEVRGPQSGTGNGKMREFRLRKGTMLVLDIPTGAGEGTTGDNPFVRVTLTLDGWKIRDKSQVEIDDYDGVTSLDLSLGQ